jgi:signal transduction histidine kinase
MNRQAWRALWFSVGPVRAISEMLLLQSFLSLSTLAVLRSFPVWNGDVPANLLILAGPGCLFWCAVRMRPFTGRWWRRLLYEVLIACAISLILISILTALALLAASILPVFSGTIVSARLVDTLNTRSIYSELLRLFVTGVIGGGLLIFGMFFSMRLGLGLIRYWNRLRRTRIRWALTHAHLLVALLGAGLISALVILVDIATRPGGGTFLQLLPILFFLLLLTCIGLAIVIPPSAIFSYFFARRLTRRIETLAKATSALRAGRYNIRLQVQGEDEIAHLQADFNAMAGSMQRAMSDLQAERDNVATLLKARRELIASVSHELRTPVATLRSYLESTREHWEETPPPTLRHDLEIMEQETIRLQALINDLFTLARAEVGRLEMRCEPADVGAVARRVAETMAPLAWQSGRVEVVADTSPDIPPAMADAARLEQVLQNLVHNAVRHTPPGGIVAITAQPAPDAVMLQVKDTGEGIEPRELPYIWERFYRTERARENPSSGTGLGLALVKELTEAMGGSVAVESTPGEGSCFTIRLRVAPSKADTLSEAPIPQKVVEAA